MIFSKLFNYPGTSNTVFYVVHIRNIYIDVHNIIKIGTEKEKTGILIMLRFLLKNSDIILFAQIFHQSPRSKKKRTHFKNIAMS